MKELYVDSVIKSFGNKQILTDIFVSCRPNEIIGLLGRNGAGKSTLLKVISGSVYADRKFIKIDNKLVKSIYQAKDLVSYIPQESFLPSHIKIKNIIPLICEKKEIENIKNNKFIQPFLNRIVKQLSGGEKKIIEILLVAHSSARYILIDEPFNGVAPIFKEEIKEIIKTLSTKKGFIITDHDYVNVLDIATRNIILQDGKITEIKNNKDLEFYGYVSNMKT